MVIREKRPLARFTGGSKHGVRALLQTMNGNGSYSLGELDDRLRAGPGRQRRPRTLVLRGERAD
jgi:hypothetical protein